MFPSVHYRSYPRFDESRRSDVYVQRLGARVDASAADYDPHFLDA
jgi:hypothetical protein